MRVFSAIYKSLSHWGQCKIFFFCMYRVVFSCLRDLGVLNILDVFLLFDSLKILVYFQSCWVVGWTRMGLVQIIVAEAREEHPVVSFIFTRCVEVVFGSHAPWSGSAEEGQKRKESRW